MDHYFDFTKAVIDNMYRFAYSTILPNKVSAMENNRRYIAEQARIFKALGHPTRLLMVAAMRSGEKCVCQLKEMVGDDMSTISKHLSILREAGIVSSEKRGTSIYYSLRLPCLDSFLFCTEKLIEQKIIEQTEMLGKS